MLNGFFEEFGIRSDENITKLDMIHLKTLALECEQHFFSHSRPESDVDCCLVSALIQEIQLRISGKNT